LDANGSIFHPMDIRAIRQYLTNGRKNLVGEIPDHALQWPGLITNLLDGLHVGDLRLQASIYLSPLKIHQRGHREKFGRAGTKESPTGLQPRAAGRFCSPCSLACPPQAGSFVLSECNVLKVFPSLRKSRRFHE